MIKKVFTLSLLLFVVFANQAFASSFKDVQRSHWAYSAITQMANQEVIMGYPGGYFRPNNQVTRAEFAAILVRVLPEPKQTVSHSFSDVPSNHWANSAINQSIALGFIKSSDFPNGKFEPNKALTRVEMSRWMANGLGEVNADYKQAVLDTKDTLLPIPEYYGGGVKQADIPYIAVALGTGLLTGYTDNTFRPQGLTTRAEVAVILVRFLNTMNKEPNDFLHLREFRAVGTIGTNIEVVTGYRIREGEEFSNVRDKKVSFRNGGGHMTLNRLIFLDGTNSSNITSAYGKMFYHKNLDRVDFSKRYIFFSEKSAYPTSNLTFTQYNQRASSTLLNGLRIADDTGFNIETYSGDGGIGNYLNQLNGEPYWEYSSITRTDSGRQTLNSIITDDGSRFGIVERVN